MDIVIIALLIILIALFVYFLLDKKTNASAIMQKDMETLLRAQSDALRREVQQMLSDVKKELMSANSDSISLLAKMLKDSMDMSFKQQGEIITKSLESLNVQMGTSFKQQSEILSKALESVWTQLGQFEKRLSGFASESEQKLENIRKTVEGSLQQLREDNNKKLDEMRKTVDEKLQDELQKRMRESFAQVSNLLEKVQKDIGSMRQLADDVGGLKKSLSSIKTRGMIGEFQLESILAEVFAQSQYEKNAHPNPDNLNAVVEFAIKIPTDDEEFIYLPIDSKFPRDTYDAVIVAAESGDKTMLDASIKQYTTKLKNFAADIRKYVAPPYTTDYAIMFLPTESMYADAVNHGMLEEIFKTYRVYITGPSTIAALLSSMQLSFRNMAIQKRASEVFRILTEVQSEFGKFSDVLVKMQGHLNATSKDLENLIGVRTRQLTRKLNNASSRISLEDSGDSVLSLTDGDD